ncbi:MAG: hypothetical protein UMV23_05435, partial [Halanaerobium sp.]|nr:hypothetical protein [Halanaerobium sp.]
MWKKHLVVLLVLSLVSMVGIYPLQAASLSFDKLPRMERFIFGEEYPDSPLKTRLDKMEEALLGKARSGDSLLTRYRDLTEIVFSDGQGPGLFITANIVEWSLQGKITERALSERVSYIERAVLGEQQEGSVLKRLEDLMTLTFPAGELELGQGTLPPSTLIQVRLLEPIDSGKNKVGDEIDFELAQDVVIDGKLLIPA